MHNETAREYIIVGAGPAGLTTAWLLAKCGASCTVVDSADDIGGCHRVNRRDGKFSEHGPRVYTSAYKTFEAMLHEMGVNYDTIFTPYKFKLSSIGGRTISNLSAGEIFWLTYAYFANALGADYTGVSMREFTKDFRPESIDYIDRLCRLTDGASISNYSVHKFLQLLNQQGTIYQPRDPNDKLLFRIWREKLEELGVKFLLRTSVASLVTTDGAITGVNISGGKMLKCKNVILAIPPTRLLQLMLKSGIGRICNMSIENFTAWAQKNSYSDFISVCFEWNNRVQLDSTWGFPETDWGIAHIVLSDYFASYSNKTLISTGITKIDSASTVTGKTARESSSDEIRSEVLRQLKQSYPSLPPPDSITIGSEAGDETAYIQGSSDTTFIPHETGVRGLYNVGTQNGKSQFSFTSLETAVVNAHSLAHMLEPASAQWPIINAWTLNQIIIIAIAVILIIIVVGYFLFTSSGEREVSAR